MLCAAGVLSATSLELADSPPCPKARTRYVYAVPAAAVASRYDVTFAPLVKIMSQTSAVPVLRSMIKPVSLLELSNQPKLTFVVSIALAIKLLGPIGAGIGVVFVNLN